VALLFPLSSLLSRRQWRHSPCEMLHLPLRGCARDDAVPSQNGDAMTLDDVRGVVVDVSELDEDEEGVVGRWVYGGWLILTRTLLVVFDPIRIAA
jgi:hypothetical protein